MKPLALLLLGCVVLSLDAAETTALKLFKMVPLPGVSGRFDHFALDAQGGRLFVAALGNNTLEVLDVAAGKRLKSIPGLHKPTGVIFLPELNQIGVANGDDPTFNLFDGASYQLTKNLPGLDDADNVRCDPKTGLIYVGYGNGLAIALKAMTLWPAFQLFEEKTKGSLEVGKFADLVILDQNPLTVDPMTIKDIKVVATIKE